MARRIPQEGKGMTTNANGAIHVEIDLSQPLPEQYLGSNEDGPQYGPTTLYDAIVKAAANNLINRALTEGALKEGYRTLGEHMKQIRDEMIRERVAPLIEEALTKPLRKTNSYGEPTGKETTLRELIGEQVRAELSNPSDRYSSRSETVLQKIVKDEVGRALDKELREALNAGKSEVLAALRAKGTEVINDALMKALPI